MNHDERERELKRVLVVLVVVLTGACNGGTDAAAPTPAATPVPSVPPHPLMDEALAEGSVRVIASFALLKEPLASWSRREIAEEQQKLLEYMGSEAQAVKLFDREPQVMLTVTPEGLQRLALYPKVAIITMDSTDEPPE